MSYISVEQLQYLNNIADALVASGHFNRSYVGYSDNMVGQRIIAVNPLKQDSDDSETASLWTGTYEILLGVSQPRAGSDAYIGTSSEPGLVYLADLVQETLSRNFDATCQAYSIGEVRYQQYAEHPRFIARFEVNIVVPINPRDRARTSTQGITVPSLQAQVLNDLADVTAPSPIAGQALIYSGGVWQPGTASTVAQFSDLTDGPTLVPSGGAIVKYDGSNYNPDNNVLISSSSNGIPLNLQTLSSVPVDYTNGDTWIGISGGSVYLFHSRSDNGQLLKLTFTVA